MVVIAQCDLTTAGGNQTQFLSLKLCKVLWSQIHRTKYFGKRCSPSGVKMESAPLQPYDRWRAPNAISDPKALESFPAVKDTVSSLLESVGVY